MGKILIDTRYNKHLYAGKDVHTNKGFVKAEDIEKAELGATVSTNKGYKYFVCESSFIDQYHKIKRGAQIIPRKDIGLMITETGINKQSVILEAGAGSGALGCFLAKICKKVYSYEIREDFFKLVKGNIEYFGLKNMVLRHQDAKLGFREKGVDVIILDLPDPWELYEPVRGSLKIGGFLVAYCPTIPQTADFVNRLPEGFVHIKTSEILERHWEVSERKVRPESQAIGHSGFISFVRRIK